MATQQTGSFGSWISPITADAAVAETGSLTEPRIDGDNIYWIEGRPLEKGRNVVVARFADGTIRDITPSPFNVRSQVYSYGGGAYTVSDNVVYFVNFGDNQIYQQVAGGAPTKITSSANCLFADICVDVTRNRLIAIREERPNGDVIKAIHTLVAIDIATGREATLDSGCHFYSSPALNVDGSKLAWLSWQHPNMPWTSTYLSVASLDQAGTLTDKQMVQGGSESLFQPQWSPDGRLYFVSDRTDFWNLYRWSASGVEHVLARDAEFGVPQWQLALSTYAIMSPDILIYSLVQNGTWRLGRLEIPTLTAHDYPMEFSSLSGVHASTTTVVLRCATMTSPAAIATVDVNTGALLPIKLLVPSDSLQRIQNYFSTPQPIEFPTSDGDIAHAFYYRPYNPDWQAPASERPPLLVKSHGGPTTATDLALNLSVQFWTSRGFGVLDVNYRGSTGMEENTGKNFTVIGASLTSWIAFQARNSLPLVAMSTAEGWPSRAAALAAIRRCAGSLFMPNLPSVRATTESVIWSHSPPRLISSSCITRTGSLSRFGRTAHFITTVRRSISPTGCPLQ